MALNVRILNALLPWGICFSHLNTFDSTKKVIIPLRILWVYGDATDRHGEIPSENSTQQLLVKLLNSAIFGCLKTHTYVYVGNLKTFPGDRRLLVFGISVGQLDSLRVAHGNSSKNILLDSHREDGITTVVDVFSCNGFNLI